MTVFIRYAVRKIGLVAFQLCTIHTVKPCDLLFFILIAAFHNPFKN